MSTHFPHFENGSVHLKVKLEIPVSITSAIMFRLVGLEMGLMLICLFINNPEAQVHSFIRRSLLKNAAQDFIPETLFLVRFEICRLWIRRVLPPKGLF